MFLDLLCFCSNILKPSSFFHGIRLRSFTHVLGVSSFITKSRILNSYTPRNRVNGSSGQLPLLLLLIEIIFNLRNSFFNRHRDHRIPNFPVDFSFCSLSRSFISCFIKMQRTSWKTFPLIRKEPIFKSHIASVMRSAILKRLVLRFLFFLSRVFGLQTLSDWVDLHLLYFRNLRPMHFLY